MRGPVRYSVVVTAALGLVRCGGASAGTKPSALSAAPTAPAPAASPAPSSTAPPPSSRTQVAPKQPLVAQPWSVNESQDKLYERACSLGSALACNDWAVANQEPTKAIVGLERACDLGLVRGCTNLALLLAAQGTEPTRVLRLLRSSCEKSDALGCVRLGDLAYNEAVPEQAEEAFRSYSKGCSLEDWYGCSTVGWMLLRGIGVSADPDRAYRHFEQSCKHQQPWGCFGLGLQLYGSAKHSADVERANGHLEWACDQGLGMACAYRGRTLVEPDGTIPERAQRFFDRACTLGDQGSCELAKLSQLPRQGTDEASEGEDGASTP